MIADLLCSLHVGLQKVVESQFSKASMSCAKASWLSRYTLRENWSSTKTSFKCPSGVVRKEKLTPRRSFERRPKAGALTSDPPSPPQTTHSAETETSGLASPPPLKAPHRLSPLSSRRGCCIHQFVKPGCRQLQAIGPAQGSRIDKTACKVSGIAQVFQQRALTTRQVMRPVKHAACVVAE